MRCPLKRWHVGLCMLLGLVGIGFSIWCWSPKGDMERDGFPGIKSQAVDASADQKLIALTFDDGPKAMYTERLLDGLRERQVNATFFLIGMQVAENEEIVRQMLEDGHQIGNHTHDHQCLTWIEEGAQRAQISICESDLNRLIGSEKPLCIRPPYGEISDAMKQWVNSPIILWSVDTQDWNGKTVEEIVTHIISHTNSGDIILMHDIYEQSVEAALLAIDEMHNRGYTFVTVEELFEAYGIPLEAGKVYRHAW